MLACIGMQHKERIESVKPVIQGNRSDLPGDGMRPWGKHGFQSLALFMIFREPSSCNINREHCLYLELPTIFPGDKTYFPALLGIPRNAPAHSYSSKNYHNA
jgi:hypothetical protein